MLTLLIYLLFILSVAFASSGIILVSRLRRMHKPGFLSTLLYFQVFIYTFGFYGIWGQLVIKKFLSDYVSAETIIRISDISILLGLPFLVFSWLMLIKFSFDISGKKISDWFVFWFLLINFIIILLIGYVISDRSDPRPALLIRYYFIILNFIYTITASVILLTPEKRRSILLKNEQQIIAVTSIIFMVAQGITLYYYKGSVVTGIVFILIFFAGNSFLPVFLSYGVKITDPSEEPLTSLSFADFCKKYDISPRESDIIQEICNGLSNKEISDKLFISLQTVKDHTSRIYFKTNVRSRTQLMKMVREGSEGVTERRRDGETERRRDGGTERQRDGGTERRRDRETE
jgi:DNA-binding CsgD family transcriptional regulator